MTLTYDKVLTTHRMLGHISKIADLADALGYPMFLWNGVVFKFTVDGEYEMTEYTVDDIDTGVDVAPFHQAMLDSLNTINRLEEDLQGFRAQVNADIDTITELNAKVREGVMEQNKLRRDIDELSWKIAFLTTGTH